MRVNIQMVKCYVPLGILALQITVSKELLAKRYEPYPILFVHGINSSKKAWDDTREEDAMGQYYLPGIYDTTEPYNPYLEAFSFSGNRGSIDYDRYYSDYPELYSFRMNSDRKGQADELRCMAEHVLEKYYGSNWANNPNAKIIIVAHSMGCATTRGFVKNWLEDGKDPRRNKRMRKWRLI